MMEEDGDDFGPLYSDTLKPCSSVKEPDFFNNQKPSNFHARSDFSVNAYKNLEEYDGFLLSECGVDEGFPKPECKVDGEFDDVIFDVEMEQKDVEFDKLDGGNEINVLGDMMDEENYDLEFEYLRSLTGDDSVDEEASESDESFDIIIEDKDLNDHNVGSDKKFVEKKVLGLLRNTDDTDDLDDLEPGETAWMKTELGIDVEARVGDSYQSFHTDAKCGRSVFMSQTIEAGPKAEQNQVNPVRNAEYNYGGTRFRYLPAHFRKAFNIEDIYSGYKPWKRPGVNLSDYFNFDLDEKNWQNYCKQMKLLLQTSQPRNAVGSKSEQLQSKNTPEKPIGEAIQVLISHSERVACLQNHHQRECDSDAIIEIVFVDTPDDTESFTKDLKDRALHGYKKCPTTNHKIINGDKILPFPLDGYFHQIYHEERTSHRLSINYAKEGRQWTDFESMVSKKQDHISYQDWSMELDHPKEKSEANQGLCGALVKYDKVMPLYFNKDVRKNYEGQTTAQNRLEDDRFHNSGEKSRRQGDGNYKKSLKQPDESKPTADVYDNQEIMDNGFDNCRMRMEEAFSQTDHQEKNNDNKLNKGSVVNEDYCRMSIEEILPLTDHQEGNNDTKDVRKNYEGQTTAQNRLEDDRFHNSGEKSRRQEGDGNYKKSLKQPDESKPTADVYDNQEIMDNGFDNCRMRMEEAFSQTDHQEKNNDNKLNKGSVVDEDNCRMSLEETLPLTDHQEGNNDTKLNKGDAVDEDNCKMRIDVTLSQTDHQEGINDNKLNEGSVVDETKCRMRIDETLSETDHQEGNNENKLNKGSAVDEDRCRMNIEDTFSQTEHQETEHQEGNRDNKLNKGSAFDEDDCGMRIDEILYETDHQEGNDDNKLNKGSAFDEDNYRIRMEETFSETDHQEGNDDNKCNKGSVVDKDICRMRKKESLSETYHQEGNNGNKLNKVDEDNCGMRIEDTLSQTDHQEGNNDYKLNKGSTVDDDFIGENLTEPYHQEGNNGNKLNKVDEDNCGMRIEDTLSQTDHQEGNNDYKLNKGSTVDDDFIGENLTEPIDNHEKEFPNDCNLAKNLENDVIFDDQRREARREENADEVQGSPQARESYRDEMKQLMSNIKVFMSEVDELVRSHKHEHGICCLR